VNNSEPVLKLGFIAKQMALDTSPEFTFFCRESRLTYLGLKLRTIEIRYGLKLDVDGLS